MKLFRFFTPISKSLNENVAARICVIYAIFSTLWILFSDQWVFLFFAERADAARVSMVKGVLFVLATSAIIYALIDRGVRAVKRSEANYRALIETSPEAIALLDLDACITMVNRRLLSLSGYDRSEDLISRNILDFVLPEDNGHVSASLRALLKTGRPCNEQYTAVRRDGSPFPVESSASLILDEGQKAKAVMIILRDITERNQAERELKLLAQTVASTKDCVSITNLDDKILFVNDAFLETYGYAQEELLGRPVSMVRSPNTPPEIGQQIHPATLNGGWYGEIFNRRKDGSDFPVELWTSMVRDGRNEPVAMVGVARDITERKRTEEALKESEKLLRESQEMAGLGSYALDIATGIWKSSVVLDDIFGIDAHFIRSVEGWTSLIHPEDRDLMADYFTNEVVGKSMRFDKQYRIVQHNDGKERWVHGLGELEFDVQHRPIKMIGTIQDITERKRSEQSLRESEARYRAVLNSANDAIVSADSHGTVVGWNNSAELMFGYRYTEAVGQPLTCLIPQFRYTEHVSGVSMPSDGESQLVGKTIELMGIRKDGNEFPLELSLAEWMIEEGRFYTGIIRDITDRKRAEGRLRQLSLAVEQSPVSIIITDLAGTIVYVNPKFSRVTGYEFEEVLGKNPRILKSGDKEGREYSQLWDAITNGKDWRGEFHNKRKNGELFWEEATISPITDNEGKITHFLAVKEDITERKALEDQLRQVQKLESIGTLAGGIAHDFNNILGIIIGHAGLIRRLSADQDRIGKSLDAINTAVQRGAGLPRQVLTFARKADVLFEPVLVNDLVVEILAMTSETFPKTVSVSHCLEPHLPPINADRTQLHQTLLNLCVNARDAMPSNGTISITTSRVESAALRRRFPTVEDINYLCLAVSDTGVGMDETTKQRIFEPFFTTKEKGRGTGLGLAVVYGIMQSHHGFVDVESAPGKGTTFRLYFPAPPPSGIPDTQMQEEQGDVPGGNETILIVEDEEMLNQLLCMVLESKGYKVLIASDGEQGLTMYQLHRNKIALVFSDIDLPKIGGDDLFFDVKRLNPEVKFILASGYIDPELKLKLVQAGARTFIHKPYIPNEILKIIREELDRVTK